MNRALLSALCALTAGWAIAACFPFDFDALRSEACDAGANAPSDCGGSAGVDGGADGGGTSGTDAGGEMSDGGPLVDAGTDAGDDAGMDAGMQSGCPLAGGDAGEVLSAVFFARPNDQHPAGGARIGTCTFVGGVRDSESGVSATGSVLTINAATGQQSIVPVSDAGFFLARDLTAAGATPILAGSYSLDTDSYVKVSEGSTAQVFGGTSSPWSIAISAQGASWADVRAVTTHPMGTPGGFVIVGTYGGAPNIGGMALEADGGTRGFAAWLPVPGGAPSRLVTFGCPDDPTTEFRVDRAEATAAGGVILSGLFRAADGCTFGLGNGNNAMLPPTSGGEYVTFVGQFEPTQTQQWLIGGGSADPNGPAVATVAPDGTVWAVYASTSGAPSFFHFADNGAALGIIDTPSADTIVQDVKVLAPSGDLLIAGIAHGTSVKFGATPVPVPNPPDAFLARLHPDGGEVGTWIYGGTGSQQITRIVPTATAGLFLYGEATGPSDFAPVESASSSDPDVFVLRVAP